MPVIDTRALDRRRLFLRAEWRALAMLNYQVAPELLYPYVPAGTDLDFWHGKTFVSLVGFRFLNTRVRGLAIPFHRNFEEVNLRFYLCRVQDGELRRGVAFIREIVPRWAIAAVARGLYNENYVALPMAHRVEASNPLEIRVEYAWRAAALWNRIRLRTSGEPALPRPDSEEQFIAEHYWGYSTQRGGRTMEYRVEHEPWRVWSDCEASLEGNTTALYTPELASVLRTRPSSAFLAEGSAVSVSSGWRI